MKLVFTGIQWCWKWTQARKLVENHSFKLLEMWWEFRKIINSWTDLWKRLKIIIDSWNQVNDELWIEIMESVIKKQKDKSIIYDWFIRNSRNKEIFDKILPDYKVIFFKLSKEKAIKRLLWRMCDPETWETFTSDTLINPNNWNKLIKRQDDNEKSILERINQYITYTIPILEIQKKEWKVIEIDADMSPEDVYKELFWKIQDML